MPSLKNTKRNTGQAMHDNKGSKVTQEVSEQRTTRRSVSYPVHSKVMGSPGAETKSPAIKLSNFEIIQQMRVVSYLYTFLQSIRLRVVDCPTQMTVDLSQMMKNTAGSSGHWTTPVTFWLQLLFWDELNLSFFETS